LKQSDGTGLQDLYEEWEASLAVSSSVAGDHVRDRVKDFAVGQLLGAATAVSGAAKKSGRAASDIDLSEVPDWAAKNRGKSYGTGDQRQRMLNQQGGSKYKPDEPKDTFNKIAGADSKKRTPKLFKNSEGEVYWVAKHSDFTPRPKDVQSHHGLMSAWMESRYPGKYNPDKAPTIFLPTHRHQDMSGIYNTWRKEMKKKHGGVFDWSKVTEAEMKKLAMKQMTESKVPKGARAIYWKEYNRMKAVLSHSTIRKEICK
jgi:hypothetical protein